MANVGDSRTVLCRGGKVRMASNDHKPSRADEQERVQRAGGFVAHRRVRGGGEKEREGEREGGGGGKGESDKRVRPSVREEKERDRQTELRGRVREREKQGRSETK